MRGEGVGRRGSGRGRGRGRRARGDLQAARRSSEGYCDVVTCIIQDHTDIDKGDSFGVTSLHTAALQGRYGIAEYLLSKGANVDPLDQDGESPLFYAASEGHHRMVKLLLEHSADCNRLSKKLLTPILMSLHGSSLKCLKILIKAGADVHETGCSVPPLALAAYKGLDDCIQCLLENGANPNLPDEANNIPLQIAAMKGWEKCVEILLPRTPQFTQYKGMNISEIVQWERTERINRSVQAIEQGDAAYWMGAYADALRFYNEAAQTGLKNPVMFAKRSLCHLQLHAPKKYAEDAITYMNMVQPDLSTAPTEAIAKRLVFDFFKTWKEIRSSSGEVSGSGSNPVVKTDEASRGIREVG